jgi:hypothetical protein
MVIRSMTAAMRHRPSCSLIDSRTILSYSCGNTSISATPLWLCHTSTLTCLLSRYSLQQSMFAPLSRFGSARHQGSAHARHRRPKRGARTCKHRDDAQDDFFNALDRAPALRRLLVHRRVIAGRVQDRDADGAIRVDCPERKATERWHERSYDIDDDGAIRPPDGERWIRRLTIRMEERRLESHLEGR